MEKLTHIDLYAIRGPDKDNLGKAIGLTGGGFWNMPWDAVDNDTSHTPSVDGKVMISQGVNGCPPNEMNDSSSTKVSTGIFTALQEEEEDRLNIQSTD